MVLRENEIPFEFNKKIVSMNPVIYFVSSWLTLFF